MEKEVEVLEDERHPLRFLMKFVVLAGLLYVAGRFLANKKNEFADLTESQARDKLMDKISPKLGDDTAEEIADQVIPKLRERGLIKPDPAEAAAKAVKDAGSEAAGAVEDAADTVKNKMDDAADKVAEAVDSVVKDKD
ncbi:MAG TPA: hypothetical protein VFS66_10490 [Acidimicrobiia bacterium]|nr:hypothetical protein [Acidimicrobiia bacterium]